MRQSRNALPDYPGFFIAAFKGEQSEATKLADQIKGYFMSSDKNGTEKLNLIATGLVTAQAVHILMNIAALPGIFARPSEGIGALLLTGASVVWTVAGVVAGIFLAVQAAGFFNGASCRHARVAAAGSLALPFLGAAGAVTAFALIPLGLLAWILLRQPEWQMLFRDGPALQAYESTEVETFDEAEAGESPTEELVEAR